jgi:hypothetical protein
MKDIKSLVDFLYDGADDHDIRHDLYNLVEQIKTENTTEVKKGPLSKALSAVGVSVPDCCMKPDYGSIVVRFDSAEEYQAAIDILELPDGMEELAQNGWVMNICGNYSDKDDDYRLRFLELEPHDKEPENNVKVPDLEKEIKDAAEASSVNKDDPYRKLQSKKSKKTV